MENTADSDRATAEKGVVDDAVRGSVRQFAGRIAHDFNNLLTPLLAYPQLIRSDLPEGGTSRDLMDTLEETAETMAYIAGRLADFALPCGRAKHPLSIDAVLRQVLVQLENEDRLVGITVTPPEESGVHVMISHDPLVTAFKAICLNALESMGGKGQLTITVDELTVGEPLDAPGGEVAVGRYARVSVHDTGPGISPDLRGKVFEPFFTTHKDTKVRGSGLGLSIALATVRDRSGYVLLGDEGEEGCTVSLLFPVDGEPLNTEQESTAAEQDSEAAATPARVLVVDDEEPIVELFKLMLESAIPSVQVDIARNGREALDSFEQGRHNVVVMDLHMPVMDGQTAFAALGDLCKEREWEMPGVVFCTGYAPPAGVKMAIAGESQHALLHKPVTTDNLVQAVKERLVLRR